MTVDEKLTMFNAVQRVRAATFPPIEQLPAELSQAVVTFQKAVASFDYPAFRQSVHTPDVLAKMTADGAAKIAELQAAAAAKVEK